MKHYFNLLDIGDRFRFPDKPDVYEKISKRKYKDGKGNTALIGTVFFSVEQVVE